MAHLSYWYASYSCDKGRAVPKKNQKTKQKKKMVNALQFNDALESSVEGELQFVFIHNNILL